MIVIDPLNGSGLTDVFVNKLFGHLITGAQVYYNDIVDFSYFQAFQTKIS